VRKAEGNTSVRHLYAYLLVSALLAAACDRSPAEPFARLIEQAASWAAATRYAGQLHGAGEVPNAYLDDVVKTGRQDVDSLRSKLAKSDHVADDERAAAVGLATELQSILAADKPDGRRLAAVEAQLRALAEKVRRS
jgi:hypothetical protein